MERNKLKEKIGKMTEGVLAEVTDMTLWLLVYFAAGSVNFSRSTWQNRVEADDFISKINYATIKNALEKLRRKGLVKRTGHKKAWPEITSSGRKRLESILPFYDEKRIWDGKIYLLTYDIPEKRKQDREILRKYARKLGMGMLLESVWITPYNPHEVLAEYISEKHLGGVIIVADIGKDGTIGDEDLRSLVSRVYKLDRLNDFYREYIKNITSAKIKSPLQKQFGFLSILSSDPQLPWDLLPDDWQGGKAYKLYKENLNKSLSDMRSHTG